jgi:hypothetical protein
VWRRREKEILLYTYKPEGNRPLGWENNIKMCFFLNKVKSLDWIILAQDRGKLPMRIDLHSP